MEDGSSHALIAACRALPTISGFAAPPWSITFFSIPAACTAITFLWCRWSRAAKQQRQYRGGFYSQGGQFYYVRGLGS